MCPFVCDIISVPVVRASGARRCHSGPNLLSQNGDSSKIPLGFLNRPYSLAWYLSTKLLLCLRPLLVK